MKFTINILNEGQSKNVRCRREIQLSFIREGEIVVWKVMDNQGLFVPVKDIGKTGGYPPCDIA